MTLADLLASLSDRYESVPFWTTEEAMAALNEGLMVLNQATGQWRQQVTQPAVPGDHYAAFPGTLISSARLLFDDVPLERVSLQDLNLCFPNWRGTTTASSGAPPTPIYFAPVSVSLVVLYPAPAAGGTLVVDGIRATPLLVDLGDTVDLGDEELGDLLAYAVHVLTFKVGGQTLVQSYGGWIGLLRLAADSNRWFARSAFYRRVTGQDLLRRDLPKETQAQPTLLDELGEQVKAVGGA